MSQRKPVILRLGVLVVAALALASPQIAASGASLLADNTRPDTVTETVSKTLRPISPVSQGARAAASTFDRERAYESLLARRHQIAATSGAAPAAAAVQGAPSVPETRAINDNTRAFSDFVVGRNNQINESGGLAISTINEPTAVNDGVEIFATQNWGAERSPDGGGTWVNVPIIEPFGDESFCCDQDTAYYAPTATTFWSVLYCDTLCNTGRVVIWVIPRISTGVACGYVVYDDVSLNAIPDFPHLGQSQKFLYISANHVGASWLGSTMQRWDVEAMSNCVGASGLEFTYTGTVGQRVFRPGLGAQASMYWFSPEDANQFRVFKWPETSTSVQQFLRAVTPITYSTMGSVPDCRGGANNANWMADFLQSSVHGFTAVTAIGGSQLLLQVDSKNDGSHPHAFVRALNLQEPGLVANAQPDIWFSSMCTGLPAITSNIRTGHFGLAIAAGGMTGGSGPPVQGYVGISDDLRPPGTPIGTFNFVVLIATGTHNPTRFGDYYGVAVQRPCGYFFDAALFALSGGTSGANVNARYTEFGRGRDQNCYMGWRNQVRS